MTVPLHLCMILQQDEKTNVRNKQNLENCHGNIYMYKLTVLIKATNLMTVLFLEPNDLVFPSLF